jgi:hypothetical protein
MSYTVETLVNDTFERLKVSGRNPQPSLIPRLITLVPTALRLLPIRVRERFGSPEAEIYRKNYSVTLSAGDGSLSTHTDLASEPMIPSEIVKVTHPDCVQDGNAEGKLQKVGSSSGLDLNRSSEYAYFAVEDNTLFTMKDNDRTALGDTATVRAAFPPTIDHVKFSHEPILLECMVELANGLPPANA